MRATTNKDIWFEILQYFRISLEDDAEDDVRLKRQVISSVALLCSELTEVALNELWRSMTTLEPIVRVFDPIFDSSELNFRYKEDDVDDAHWDVTISAVELRSRLPRIRSYLNRIHAMHFAAFPKPKEYTLWHVVQNLGGISCLCPNLEGLFLALEHRSSSLIHHLYPLISPSITAVTFVASPASSTSVTACILLDMLSCHNAELLKISFLSGYLSPRLFQRITQFTSLRSLILAPKAGDYSDSHSPARRLGDTQITSLQHLSHLRTLAIDVDMVRHKSEKTTGHQLARLEALASLELRGRSFEIRDCLFDDITFYSLVSLSLFFTPEDARRGLDPFPMIPCTFPKLQSLLINYSTQIPPGTLPIAFGDLISGLGGRRMTHLSLLNIPCKFFSQDIVYILTTWPTLKQLSIVPASMDVYFDAKYLPWMSVHAARLESLYSRFDFGSLTQATPTTCPSPKCPLQTLKLTKPMHVPGDLKAKHDLAQMLIALFPRLAVIEAVGLDSDVRGRIQDIQLLINGFRKILTSPPNRPDCLFC